jgi:DMSO reductase anchor subunit
MKKEKFSDMISLILFTSFLPIAAGIATGTAVSYCFSVSPVNIFIWSQGVALLFTITGAAFVTVHLGKKGRGVYAVKGIVHSYLSLESAVSFLFGLFLFLSFLSFWLSQSRWLTMVALAGAAVFGWLTAIVIGKVYDLRGQLTWRGTVPLLGPLMTVFLVAIITLIIITDNGGWLRIMKGCLMTALGVEVLFLISKLQTFLSLRNQPFVLTYRHLRGWVICLYITKFGIIGIIFLLLIKSLYPPVVYLSAIMILLDRTVFYASGAQATPESNVLSLKSDRMQAALKDAGGSDK